MLRTILIGLDGSPDGAAALSLGIDWARRFDAMLVGLGVVDEPTIRGPEAQPPGAAGFRELRDRHLLDDARRTVEGWLERFSLACAAAGVASKPLEDVGLPHEALLAEAQRYDLVLLPLRPHFHFETQDEADDTLRRVVRAGARPVLAVPGSARTGGPVVVAYDGSARAARTLQAFQSLGLALEDDLHVLAVGDDRAEAHRHAERAVDFLEKHLLRARAEVLAPDGPIARVLLDRARALGARLMVMGAYGHGPLRELVFGSVTRDALREADLPLFLYH